MSVFEDLLKSTPGLRRLNAKERKAFAEYEKEMREKAIPEILAELRLREQFAAEARARPVVLF